MNFWENHRIQSLVFRKSWKKLSFVVFISWSGRHAFWEEMPFVVLILGRIIDDFCSEMEESLILVMITQTIYRRGFWWQIQPLNICCEITRCKHRGTITLFLFLVVQISMLIEFPSNINTEHSPQHNYTSRDSRLYL